MMKYQKTWSSLPINTISVSSFENLEYDINLPPDFFVSLSLGIVKPSFKEAGSLMSQHM